MKEEKNMNQMIHTIKGDLPMAELTINKIEEEIPCGKGIATKYYHGEQLVREDYHVIVDADKVQFVAQGDAGKV
jgi:hypothetical protein